MKNYTLLLTIGFVLLTATNGFSQSSSQSDGCATGSETPTVYDSALEDDVFNLINSERVANGKTVLIRNTDLDRAARYHVQDMAADNYFAHTTYDSIGAALVKIDTCTKNVRIKKFYADEGLFPEETLFAGTGTIGDDAADVVTGPWGWINSTSGHKEIMLSNNFNEVGVGYFKSTVSASDHYWAATFGYRAGVNIDVLPTYAANSFKVTTAYPNPFRTTTSFSLTVSKSQKVKIEVLDLLGQRVLLLYDSLLTANSNHQFTINADLLNSGNMYFYKITGEGFHEVRKISVQR